MESPLQILSQLLGMLGIYLLVERRMPLKLPETDRTEVVSCTSQQPV